MPAAAAISSANLLAAVAATAAALLGLVASIPAAAAITAAAAPAAFPSCAFASNPPGAPALVAPDSNPRGVAAVMADLLNSSFWTNSISTADGSFVPSASATSDSVASASDAADGEGISLVGRCLTDSSTAAGVVGAEGVGETRVKAAAAAAAAAVAAACTPL